MPPWFRHFGADGNNLDFEQSCLQSFVTNRYYNTSIAMCHFPEMAFDNFQTFSQSIQCDISLPMILICQCTCFGNEWILGTTRPSAILWLIVYMTWVISWFFSRLVNVFFLKCCYITEDDRWYQSSIVLPWLKHIDSYGNLDTSRVERTAFNYSEYDTKVVYIFSICFMTVGEGLQRESIINDKPCFVSFDIIRCIGP